MKLKMKIKTRMEITSRKGKIYVQFYVKDTEILLRTYIFREEDTFTLDGVIFKFDDGEVINLT